MNKFPRNFRLLCGLSLRMFWRVLLVCALVLAAKVYHDKKTEAPDWKRFGPMPPKVTITESAERLEQKEIQRRALRLLRDKNYSELETMAAEFRKSKAMFPDGVWKLAIFYNGVAEIPEETSNFEWEDHLSTLKSWSEALPKSPTAPVALARSWSSFAWKARGSDFANTVSKQMHELFEERISRAHKILLQMPDDVERCPGYYNIMQRIALAQSWERELVDKLFETAIKAEPTYTSFYFAQLYHLMPQWYGKKGEWLTFAKTAADRVGGEEGDILYARMIANVWGFPYAPAKFFDQFPETRERTNEGFARLRKRYPDSLQISSQYCRLAGALQNLDMTKILLIQIDGRVDLTVWDRTEQYVNYYKWANY
jgi:hypothetical protein